MGASVEAWACLLGDRWACVWLNHGKSSRRSQSNEDKTEDHVKEHLRLLVGFLGDQKLIDWLPGYEENEGVGGLAM